MKSKFLSVMSVLLLISSLQWSCSNDIDVIGEWKEIPVVYGVVTFFPQGAVNYFRIEKAYLDPSTDAYEIAQRPDSLYYGPDEIEVILYERVDAPGYPDEFVPIDTLERINADTIGMPRDSGIFATSPNIVYRCDAISNNNDNYRFYKLVIHNKITGKTFTQRTIAMKPGNYDYTEFNFPGFKVTNPAYTQKVRWAHESPTNGEWIFDDFTFIAFVPYPASIYDMSLIIRYEEYEVDLNQAGNPEIPGTRVQKQLLWKPVRNNIIDGTVERVERFGEYYYQFSSQNVSAGEKVTVRNDIRGEAFFNFMKNNLSDVTGTNLRRCLSSNFDVGLDCAGSELSEYISSYNSNQNLIGGLYPSDPFTNIEDGFGIFTTKLHVEKYGIEWHADVFEYLKYGEITQNLGFENISCN